jgi:NAD(P)-dependent dehydrogenase (short-subunit alcohol dehydrogenase family)
MTEVQRVAIVTGAAGGIGKAMTRALDDAVMLPCANRTDKAGWPTPAHHRLPALILCSVKNSKLGLAEPLLKLHRVARHRSNPQKQPYVPVLYQALMAEDSA